jgi:hypothetical protein
MQSEPGPAGETKEHLFAMGFGMFKEGTGESRLEGFGLHAPKDPGSGVQRYGEDTSLDPGIPPGSVIIDFRQFRHGTSGGLGGPVAFPGVDHTFEDESAVHRAEALFAGALRMWHHSGHVPLFVADAGDVEE